MANNRILWQTKLAARLHDPAEKALVLMRDPAGHEGGSIRDLKDILFKNGISDTINRHCTRADWWAAAADRPNFPWDERTFIKGQEEKTVTNTNWATIRWANEPILLHPLSGEKFDLGKSGGLRGTEIGAVKERSFAHHERLAQKGDVGDGEQCDWQKLLLTYWRFGSDLDVTDSDTYDNDRLGKLWEVLPADTRIPDHSIWDHLDLTSAFAGAFAGDENDEAALLSLSIGPVQPFIAVARTTSDLWAGSHLLSRLSWEAMRPVCEQLGPDAILFPRLRGIPQVDLWLRDQMGLSDDLFTKESCEWKSGTTDANPLFSAALPNRFVAVVPASQAKAIAESVEKNVREWLGKLGDDVVTKLLTVAGYGEEQECSIVPREQMKEQLQGFPEVHWAVVPFSLIKCGDEAKQRDLDICQLSASMKPFFSGEGEPGFLGSQAWKILREGLQLNDEDGKTYRFFSPNPGVLYPAVFDLAERALAASKASRTFEQTTQQGWRDSLTGESEWLTTDKNQLIVSAGKRKSKKDESFRDGEHIETLWTLIADEKPSWAKKGEHLGGLSAIKRLWPTMFMNEVKDALGKEVVSRFVVSTHTMALAHQIDQWLEHGGLTSEGFSQSVKDYKAERVALPRRLMLRHKNNQSSLKDAGFLPSLLDKAIQEDIFEQQDAKNIRQIVCKTLSQGSVDNAKDIKLETYYSLIMMDGDRMGAILSGDEKTNTAISYLESFHPKVQKGFNDRASKQADLKKYGDQKRAMSPNRHLAVSGALNDFSQTVVRHVVEEEHLGRVIYAGGDDVLAMLPVADMLPTMQRLRHAYSGTVPEDEHVDWSELRKRNTLVCKGGFAWLKGRLMRMMGKNATASCGAIIAHHQAPLGAVLRELRAAESRAKNYNDGDRDAFSVTIIKRSGGALYLTERWHEPVKLLVTLREFLMTQGVSRRAVYHTLEWMKEHELPADTFESGMAQSLLRYQLERQASGVKNKEEMKEQVAALTTGLTKLARAWPQEKRIEKLRNFLSVAEFLARETRTDNETGGAE